MSPQQPQMMGGIELPPVTPLTRNVLVALFVLYVIELTAANVLGLPTRALAWSGFGEGFALYQPFTRYLVQGNGVFGVVIAGVVLYFFLPIVERLCNTAQLVEALIAGAIGGTVLGLILDAIGLLHGMALGWSVLVEVLVVLFGLMRPKAVIRLFFILPIEARLLVWGAALVGFLLLLATMDLMSADFFGTLLGTVGWWHTRGPAGHRRKLLRDASRIERELDRFTVLPGGRQDSQDDDFVH
ncbi:MAG: hypothetical protein JRI25_09020 [Deltaproteobacteria bacterium]|nr:hypothetical protein [Deltaproteobacteria bacterium]